MQPVFLIPAAIPLIVTMRARRIQYIPLVRTIAAHGDAGGGGGASRRSSSTCTRLIGST